VKQRKNFKLDDDVVKVMEVCAGCTGNTDTRIVEAALVAYGAQILGRLHPTVEQARGNLQGFVNKNKYFNK
jgi:hypothetical protein